MSRGPAGTSLSCPTTRYKADKARTHGTSPGSSERLGEWLETQRGSVLVGMDANSPDVDHLDEDKVVCCFAQPESRHREQRFLGPQRKHRLDDV